MKAVSDALKETIETLQQLETLKRFGFGLAGGTNIALRLEHRMSIDIDLFTNQIIGDKGYTMIGEELIDVIKIDPKQYHYHFQNNNEKFGSSKLMYPLSDGKKIKVDIIDNVQRLNPLETKNNISLLSLKDVGVQKLIALGGRVHKKDFYDLDHITDQIPLMDLMAHLETKLKQYPYPQYDSIFEKNLLGYPTQRTKLLLSYIELYPGEYDHQLRQQTIQPIRGKTWEASEKSWIQKARQAIYQNDRYPQDLFNIKTLKKDVSPQKQQDEYGYGY
ncbi:MAG: nucleotidyl transferase AbiEii/AbiGii toxin family protein [Flavobacteriaceae bacterium]|nr:nucleotidyl transferase AbiEii/AbiGii toxin family protein [Flavobacteriaceae bacterium]